MSEMRLGETKRTHFPQPRDQMYKSLLANPSEILFENEHIWIAINRFPQHDGNVMVVPKRQVTDLRELTAAESHAILIAVEHSAEILEKAFGIPCMVSKYFGEHVSQDPLHFHIYPVEKKYRDLYYEANDLHVWEITQDDQDRLQSLFSAFFDKKGA